MATQLCEHLAQTLLHTSYDALDPVQQRVIDAVAQESPTGASPLVAAPSYGDRLADRVAAIGGSWAFILAFALVLFGWMVLNSPVMKGLGVVFDPYPFIFLNLLLSTLAAVQAPIIMMSQNRAAAKDRQSAEHDYQVNLRAELEILRVHDRLDALERDHLPRIVETQNAILGVLHER